ARRRLVRRGAVGPCHPEAGRRVHLLELLSGSTPQPVGQRKGWRDDLYGLRGLSLTVRQLPANCATPTTPARGGGYSPASRAWGRPCRPTPPAPWGPPSRGEP